MNECGLGVRFSSLCAIDGEGRQHNGGGSRPPLFTFTLSLYEVFRTTIENRVTTASAAYVLRRCAQWLERVDIDCAREVDVDRLRLRDHMVDGVSGCWCCGVKKSPEWDFRGSHLYLATRIFLLGACTMRSPHRDSYIYFVERLDGGGSVQQCPLSLSLSFLARAEEANSSWGFVRSFFAVV